ncbi:MAG TPA: prepilin-type N-terminal cleavage/methylation domain-containing protein [Vicinamibacterales bacterium]|nr:prepilin-type N-terminal cleavage/methylation domain-containing protein [Vicinamibacterales bacterium]
MATALRKSEAGFSLPELVIAVAIFSVIMAVMFQQVDQAQQASITERAKLDVFQESRAFMDLMSRDLHEAGYPSPRNFAPEALTLNPLLPRSPYAADARVAVGLTRVAVGDLWFEGDVDGTGRVSVVQYHLDTTGDGCPCLRRSQQGKAAADPLAQVPTYQVEVQNVQNGTAERPMFFAFAHGSTGTALTLPLDFNTNPDTIASIDTIKVVLTVESSTRDPKTSLKPTTTLVSTVRLNNCSSAASGQFLSCQ